MVLVTIVMWVGHVWGGALPPEFPNVGHFFVTDVDTAIGRVFYPRPTTPTNTYRVGFAHQNREWGYNWMATAMVVPTSLGQVGVGYSWYGTASLPRVAQDALGPYQNGQVSDAFHTMVLAFQPQLKSVNLAIQGTAYYREFVDKHATTFQLSAAVSSPYVWNNQVGIRLVNALGHTYQWSSGEEAVFPQYAGIYWTPSWQSITGALDYSIATNYTNVSVLSACGTYKIGRIGGVTLGYKQVAQSPMWLMGISIHPTAYIRANLTHIITSKIQDSSGYSFGLELML